ncbi:MAG TPA: hypothetical protein VFQ58_05150 [Flavisolibacter sp.]|jgi:hypothetical protein|nr:hypothetical protein [Flavisolibacter sp.]
MKKYQIFSLIAAVTFSAVACNNNGSETSSTDSTSSNSATTTQTSTNNYAARADSLRINSEGGNYLNPRSGKPYRLNMDKQSGAITDETGHPVKRYVDKRTWWIYDATSGDTLGSARMNNGNLMYRGTTGDWVPYDQRWTDDTSGVNNNNSNTSNSSITTADSNGTSSGTTGEHGKTKVKIKSNGSKSKTTDKGDR